VKRKLNKIIKFNFKTNLILKGKIKKNKIKKKPESTTTNPSKKMD
jgi:hypothetical protein